MKKFVLLFLFHFCAFTEAQSKLNFTYDNAGNQITRVLCINCQAKPMKEASEIEASTKNNIKEFFSEDVISYYPNPVKEELHLQWQLVRDNYVTSVQLFSMNGQVLRSYQLDNTLSNLDIPFQSYPSGMYLVLLSYKDGGEKSIKIIKK